jgi:hypothetical protein
LLKIANKETFNMETKHLSCSCCKCRISVARMHLGCWYLPLSMLAVILSWKVDETFRRRNMAVITDLKYSSKVLGKINSVYCGNHGEELLE